jgi:hypothetical protein
VLEGRQGAELLHQGEKVRNSPMLGDLSLAYAHDINGFEVDQSAGWRHAKEWSLVCSVICLVGRYQAAVGGLVMNVCMKIKKGAA